MSIFGRKEIKVLKNLILARDSTIEILQKENRELKKALAGEHVTGKHCIACENAYLIGWDVECKLEIKCRDFKDKDAKLRDQCKSSDGPAIVI